jgi:hypothetical protein
MKIKKRWLPEAIDALMKFAKNFCLKAKNLATELDISSDDQSKTDLILTECETAQIRASSPDTRTALAVGAAKVARADLKKHLRYLRDVYIEPGFKSGAISLEQYRSFGLELPDEIVTDAPNKPQTIPYIVKVVSIPGHRVQVNFRDQTSEKSEARPQGTNGCLAYFLVSTEKVQDIKLLPKTQLMTTEG